MDPGQGWAPVFAEIAGQLAPLDGTDATLHAIAQLATTIEGCTWAAIVADTDLLPVIAAVSDPRMATRIARVQASGNGGPTWQAVATGTSIYLPDLFSEGRWPEHVLELLDHTPVRSVLAIGLHHHNQQPLGALTLYSNRPHAFPPTAQQQAAIYATHTALTLAHTHPNTRTLPPNTSTTITDAVHTLATRYQITTDQAHALLLAASHYHGINPNHLATEVTRTGRL